MSPIKRKLLVLSGKGGVGKSSVAAGLALALASRPSRVGVLDVDLCGPSMPTMLLAPSKQVVTSPYGWMPIVYAASRVVFVRLTRG